MCECVKGLGRGSLVDALVDKALASHAFVQSPEPDRKLSAVSHTGNSRDGKMGGTDR